MSRSSNPSMTKREYHMLRGVALEILRKAKTVRLNGREAMEEYAEDLLSRLYFIEPDVFGDITYTQYLKQKVQIFKNANGGKHLTLVQEIKDENTEENTTRGPLDSSGFKK